MPSQFVIPVCERYIQFDGLYLRDFYDVAFSEIGGVFVADLFKLLFDSGVIAH